MNGGPVPWTGQWNTEKATVVILAVGDAQAPGGDRGGDGAIEIVDSICLDMLDRKRELMEIVKAPIDVDYRSFGVEDSVAVGVAQLVNIITQRGIDPIIHHCHPRAFLHFEGPRQSVSSNVFHHYLFGISGGTRDSVNPAMGVVGADVVSGRIRFKTGDQKISVRQESHPTDLRCEPMEADVRDIPLWMRIYQRLPIAGA